MKAASRPRRRRFGLSAVSGVELRALRGALTLERDAEGRRPFLMTSAYGAVAAVLVGLLLCIALALIGWYLADGGAHGETTGAVGVGAGLWALGNGATLATAAGTISVVPLGLTATLALIAFRCGRWAGADAESDDRTFASALGVFVGTYLVLAVVIAVAAASASSTPTVPGVILGSLLLAGLGGGAGLAVATGSIEAWWARVPYVARSAARVASSSALAVLGLAAVAAGASFAFNFGEAVRVYSGLGLQGRDALSLTVVCLVFLPNVVAWAIAYLLGPGFAFGTGTSVMAGSVVLGPMPAVPVLAAIPHGGRGTGWLALLIALPPLVALVVAGREQRATSKSEANGWDQVAIRSFSGGAAAGILLWLFVMAAGGSMGPGRMSHIGGSGFEVLLAGLGMGLASLAGGLLVAWLDRRRG